MTGNRILNNLDGIDIELGVTDYLITSNNLVGNTNAITDDGGAVNKVVANNLT